MRVLDLEEMVASVEAAVLDAERDERSRWLNAQKLLDHAVSGEHVTREEIAASCGRACFFHLPFELRQQIGTPTYEWKVGHGRAMSLRVIDLYLKMGLHPTKSTSRETTYLKWGILDAMQEIAGGP